ncbi:hypothetical protein GCM10009081_32750 [Brevundimonas nasdae]
MSVPATMSWGLASMAWKPLEPITGAQAADRPASETATKSGAKRDMVGRLRENKVFDLDGPAS